MTQLNSDQFSALVHAPDRDISLYDARSLLKSVSDYRNPRKESGPHRKRSVPNIFTTLSGRASPRQGFLSVEIMRAIYMRSELIRACVDTIIEIVAGCEWTIRPVDEDKTAWMKKKDPDAYLEQQKMIQWLKDFFRRPNDYENFDQFSRRLLRDLLIFDAAGYEVVKAEYPNGRILPIELGVVAGDTIEIECDLGGIPQGYWQSYNVVHQVPFSRDELAYLQMNPCSWSPYGISPIETAYISIASDLNALQFNNSYFAKNGIPPGLLAVIGVSDAQFKAVMAQLRSTSADNPHNLHAFRANRNPDGNAQKIFEFVPLTQATNREMQFKELLDMCVNRVTMAYKLSPSMIGFTDQVTGGIGSGVAETQEDLMQNKAIGPILRTLAAAHTYNVIHCLCDRTDLEFQYSQSNTPQEQQDYQRGFQECQTGIISINEFRAARGKKPVEWGDKPLGQAAQNMGPSPEELQQQAMGMGGGAPGGPPQPPEMQKAIQPEPAIAPQKRIIINL